MLESKIRLEIKDGYYINACIWPTRAAMLENSGLEGDGYIAGWLASPYFKYDDGGHETPALFGEIHLTENDFGAGWFAHELQHFVLDFIDRFKLDFAGKDNEMICTIVGEMTTAFWVRFYELYEEDVK